jgi:pimeloyl-ACP methyl ester carboxylesterase
MGKLRRFRRVVFLLSVYFAICSLAGAFIAEMTLHPDRRVLLPSDEQGAREMAQNQNAELADVNVLAADGSRLAAWIARPHLWNHTIVILLHGLSDNRMGMIGYAALLLHHGFSVLMPDSRAHGSSGGALATYGLLEQDDIRRWFEWASQQEAPSCIFGFGESMGAAQLLQALQSEPEFCAVAAESPFSNMREIAYDRVGQFFRTGPWLGRSLFRPVVEIAFQYARWKYHVDLEQVMPDRAVAGSQVPISLIHGREDRNIPLRHSRKIASENPRLTLWEVSGADHCGAISVAPQEFERRLVEWFEAHDRVVTSIYDFPTIAPASFGIFPV